MPSFQGYSKYSRYMLIEALQHDTFALPGPLKLITSNIKLVLDSLSWWDFGFVRKETNFLLTIWSVGWQFVILMGQNGFFSNFLEVRDGRALCLPYSQYCLKNKNLKKKASKIHGLPLFFHVACCKLCLACVLGTFFLRKSAWYLVIDFIDYINHVIFT